jgi:hypothetical protein
MADGLLSIRAIFKSIGLHGPRRAISYFFGRFYLVRRFRRLFRKKTDSWVIDGIRSTDTGLLQILNPDINDHLRDKGYAIGIQLTSDSVKSLISMIQRASFVPSRGSFSPGQNLESIERYNLEHARDPVVLANIKSQEIDQILAKIATDATLLHLVRSQLSGGIKRIERYLQISFVNDASDLYRESQGQTVMFHFDVHDLDFVYVFFYLEDVDADSGAHELVEGSHISKSLALLYSSARKPTNLIVQNYPKELFKIICGPAGYGFIEDTSCFHRARPPVSKPRIALQIRYS